MDKRTDRHVEEILLRFDHYEFDADEAVAELRKILPGCTEAGARSMLRPRLPRRRGKR